MNITVVIVMNIVMNIEYLSKLNNCYEHNRGQMGISGSVMNSYEQL